MGYVRLYADDHGESHFEDLEIEFEDVDLAPPASPVRASAPTDAARFLFVTGPPGWISERHPAPRRQLYLCLRGAVEITASDGETRRFEPGIALLMEDTEGNGHTTRVVSEEDTLSVFVQLD